MKLRIRTLPSRYPPDAKVPDGTMQVCVYGEPRNAILEQWDEHRGGWFPIEIEWEPR